jgi:hypothetical protein
MAGLGRKAVAAALHANWKAKDVSSETTRWCTGGN